MEKVIRKVKEKTFLPIIYNNIITTMKTLVTQTESKCPIQSPELLQLKTYIDELKGDEEIDANLAQSIQALWTSQEVQETYKQRASFHLTDSAAYFNDKILEVGAEGYIPSEQDVLRSRVRTTGIVENEFEIDRNQFKMFDVGGQRNERKKWIHCFENVTAVLFVAAISEYDQMLYEDESTNRIVEALNLFEEICNSRWFRETSMILFLNKRDLFEEKILNTPLESYFPDYQGGPDPLAAKQFMQDQFEMKNRNPEKQIYTHVTCATDTQNIESVFNAVKDIIIRKSLNEAGLV